MKCPNCNNKLEVAGTLEDGRKVYYCKVCKWRGLA